MSTKNPSNHYLALTIGPVVKTLLEARKTRELWAASYLLSTLMKHLVQNLDPDGKHLLIPKIPDEVQHATLYGAGIYPDRLFMEAAVLTEAQIEKAINDSLKSLAKDCLLKEEAGEVDNAVIFWKQFFRIRYVLIPLEDIKEGKLSTVLSPFLDTLELEDTCMDYKLQSNYLLQLFDKKRLFRCKLVDALQDDNRGAYSEILEHFALFPATHEFASFELFEREPANYLQLSEQTDEEKNEVFYQEIETNDAYKQLKKHFKPRHKYFCIVQADGDSIGEAIKKLNTVEEYRQFSETLARYGQTAASIINEYGGKPIYIGGDDLLFLAPLSTKEASIFDLLDKLDKAFPKAQLHPEASLSFGLNIVYYKFPLFEAIGDAYGILKKAKDYPGKNAVSFQFTKHSGSAFSAVFSKGFLEGVFAAIEVFETHAPKGRASIVSSLIFKLLALKQLLTDLAKRVEATTDAAKINAALESRLDSTLEQFYGEWNHEPGFEAQKKAVKTLLMKAYLESKGPENWIMLFYAVMRLIQFTISPSETNQYDTENIAATAG
ncbi:MAG: type III-B CRISPR-associated protein Cas10/Cmr2 [Saprospiraceae bacterium]|nr:type III-B CRISPR-associated protein Cas10/Cmr2 [Saprospiraceae bacterium]